jgi:hypothetical protein
LQWLSLVSKNLGDLTPLTGLTNLQTLFFGGDYVKDLSPLAGLVNLRKLHVEWSEIEDLAPLSGLTNLHSLSLRGDITDTAPLLGLSKLRELALHGMTITDARPLSRLTSLLTLDLSGTKITDAAHFTSLTALRMLNISHTEISDLRALTHLEGLDSAENATDGLRFTDIPATRIDPKLKKLSEIEDGPERTLQTFDYLRSLGDDWPPVPAAPDVQNPAALTFATDAAGRISLNETAPSADLPPQAGILHGLLRGQAADLRAFCTTPNREHDRLCGKLDRYLQALGDSAAAMAPPPVLWVAGNDLRNILKADGAKTGEEMGEAPLLGPDRRADLTGLVQTHNAFSALHPDLVRLDHDSIDPADRVFGAENRAALEQMVRVIDAQIRTIADQVRSDFASLDASARGNATGAARALSLESESLHNLVKLVVAESVIQIQAANRPRIGAEIRAAAIGTLTGAALTNATLNPVIAQNLPELMLLLQPYAAVLLSCWQGNTGNLRAAMDWVALRIRAGI